MTSRALGYLELPDTTIPTSETLIAVGRASEKKGLLADPHHRAGAAGQRGVFSIFHQLELLKTRGSERVLVSPPPKEIPPK